MTSVIIPNYNHARFLGQRIDSILAQTCDDYEIIVLDDCSTDDSRQVIEQYRENPHVAKILYNELNSGSPFSQWKKGMEAAKGDRIWIAESDDYCEPDFLMTANEAFAKCPDCVLWFCASDKVDANGVSSGLHPNLEGIPTIVLPGYDFARKYMGSHNAVVNASSVIFRKDRMLDLGEEYFTMSGYGDYLLWADLMQKGLVAYSSNILNHFRFHSCNTTSKMVVSLKGIKESAIVNKLLYDKKIRPLAKYLSVRFALLYILKYKSDGYDENQVRDVIDTMNPCAMDWLAVGLKYVKKTIIG